MEAFFEILKYTIPSLVVFATAYFILKQQLDDRYNQAMFSKKLESQKATLPLRLQAYERFALFCDRMAVPNLLLRVRQPGMTVRDLQAAMMVNIHMEFEHNMAQQVYISETLWQIISLAVENTVVMISNATATLDPGADSDMLVDALSKSLQDQDSLAPLQKAISAIRAEVASLF